MFDLIPNPAAHACGEIAEHFLLNCLNYTDIRNSTIGRLAVPYSIETLLKGCPLFSDFKLSVQRNIPGSSEFYP